MLRFEANVAGTLRTVLDLVKNLKSRLEEDVEDDVRDAYATELPQALIEKLPDLSRSAQDAAARDTEFAATASGLVELAPKLIAATVGAATTPSAARAAADTVVEASRSVIHLDEVSCPHCDGRGTTGLMGRLCAYCGGDQVVTEAMATPAMTRVRSTRSTARTAKAAAPTGLVGTVFASIAAGIVCSQRRGGRRIRP